MSEFDKEAEREKLREKYAQEAEKREATQRMSELLLRGATMTNQHCDTCGSPLFRYEGQVFCPTCQTGQDGATGDGVTPAAAAEGEPEEAADGAAATSQDVTGGEPDDAAGTDSHASQDASTTQQAQGRQDHQEPQQPQQSPQSRSRPQSRPTRDPTLPSRRSSPWPDRPPADADLPALRETDPGDAPGELEAVVARLARRAAATEDPTQAREWLAGAREASEALAALRSSAQR